MGSDGSEKKVDLASEATIRATTRPLEEFGGSDDQILDAVRRGDRKEALLLCARHHGRSVGRLCMALLGSASEADDAVQDTLLAAHAAFPGYRGEGSLRAWLFSIARRRCAKVLERRSTRTGVERRAAEDGVPKSADTAEALLDARRRAEAARALLAQVRPTEREALLLRYEAGLSYREVGEACGIDEAAARKRVSRALTRLRELAKE